MNFLGGLCILISGMCLLCTLVNLVVGPKNPYAVPFYAIATVVTFVAGVVAYRNAHDDEKESSTLPHITSTSRSEPSERKRRKRRENGDVDDSSADSSRDDPSSIEFSVRLVDSHERPVPGVKVWLHYNVLGTRYETTDDNGVAEFSHCGFSKQLPGGSLLVRRIEAEGETLDEDLRIEHGNALEYTFDA